MKKKTTPKSAKEVLYKNFPELDKTAPLLAEAIGLSESEFIVFILKAMREEAIAFAEFYKHDPRFSNGKEGYIAFKNERRNQ